ncbi:BCCT family transporter [Algivirga pacifica]|uniref:BCCT family transporter n=1 Tax=Algivirga pacifica TaxID=1162670 RepID=A0ABP9D4J4_9BACT
MEKVRSDQKTFLGLKVNGPVAGSAFFIVALLVIVTLVVGDPMEEWFQKTQKTVSQAVGWLFILVINLLLVFAFYLGFSKYGNIRLGGPDAKPEFTRAGWFAMLFSAGMGIGLLFWSVAEPISHFNANPFMNEATPDWEAAKISMGITFLHWGIHAWALYAVIGVALAFFTFNLKLPLTIRSAFYPLLGTKVYGLWGDIIDIIAVVATIFGLAASLGFGVQQVNAGLTYLLEVPESIPIQLILIGLITGLAIMSLVLGLDSGIRMLSEWNVRIAFFLLIALLVIGPTIFLLKSFVQNIGYYFYRYFELSFWTNSYHGVKDPIQWQNKWTIFYWAWWISWSPFVGIFIARISKGRTVREFIFGVLVIPSLVTFLWLSVFGGSALYQELTDNHAITAAVNKNVATAIYYLLEQYPLTIVTSTLALLLVISFFVTSSDSGSFVVDVLTSGGRHDSPTFQKVFWAGAEGAVAGVLLIGGGLTALQTASVLTGLPFAFLIVIMCYSLIKAMNGYLKRAEKAKQIQERKKREKDDNR